MPVVRNPQFYFREGFCWIDVNSTYLKARLKTNGVFDVLSMSLFTMTNLPDWYFVSLINSKFISLYVDNFINNTSHFQINDARQLPVIVPKENTLMVLKEIVRESIECKKKLFYSQGKERHHWEEKLKTLQNKLDDTILNLYMINI